jgi:hypothetical protein
MIVDERDAHAMSFDPVTTERGIEGLMVHYLVDRRRPRPPLRRYRAPRRTLQDLCRAAQVHDFVARSISGHATVEMQQLYSSSKSATGSRR